MIWKKRELYQNASEETEMTGLIFFPDPTSYYVPKIREIMQSGHYGP